MNYYLFIFFPFIIDLFVCMKSPAHFKQAVNQSGHTLLYINYLFLCLLTYLES